MAEDPVMLGYGLVVDTAEVSTTRRLRRHAPLRCGRPVEKASRKTRCIRRLAPRGQYAQDVGFYPENAMLFFVLFFIFRVDGVAVGMGAWWEPFMELPWMH